MSIWKWRDLQPAIPAEHCVSLGEGSTPLLASRRIGPEAGLRHLYFKLETTNPTGSYKDRFAASVISHMRSQGQSRCIATSSGNTGSALAAYCAAASIDCAIAVVETTPTGKLQQMLAYGARVFRIQGFGIERATTERAFEMMESLGKRPQVALQISAYKYSPLGMTGVQTIAYELASQLGAVNHVFIPAGGGGLTLAVAKGFQQLVGRKQLDVSPRVHCVQPAGNDTIATALRRGLDQAVNVECTTTISGLQVPSVLDGDDVIAACRRTGGNGHIVNDDNVFAIQRRLANCEGIFVEPAGAVAVTAALSAAARGEINPDDTVVCLLTGSGFKDPVSIERITKAAACPTIRVHELENCLTPQDSRQ